MLMSMPCAAKAKLGKKQIAVRSLVKFRCMVASKRGNAAWAGILSGELLAPTGLITGSVSFRLAEDASVWIPEAKRAYELRGG